MTPAQQQIKNTDLANRRSQHLRGDKTVRQIGKGRILAQDQSIGAHGQRLFDDIQVELTAHGEDGDVGAVTVLEPQRRLHGDLVKAVHDRGQGGGRRHLTGAVGNPHGRQRHVGVNHLFGGHNHVQCHALYSRPATSAAALAPARRPNTAPEVNPEPPG